jgi:tetratricopeptide (TPR) repeat protein
VLGQLQPAYLKTQQFDKVFPLTDQLIAFDASDAEMAYGGLQAAVGKNDAALISKWATATVVAAKLGEKTAKPSDEDELARWEYKVKFSQQVQERAEYEVFTAALRTNDPGQRVQLAESLAQLNPNSKYIPQLDDAYFNALRQTGQNDKAFAYAEKVAQKGSASEDLLLMLANNALEKKQNDQAIGYSDKLVELMKTKPAPAGVSPADWEKKKNTSLGAGLFMKGMALASTNKLSDADLVLREALPFLQGNEALLGPTLFQLGLANYRLGAGKKPDQKRLRDALQYSRQASAIKGAHQGQAAKNVQVIQSQYGLK